MEEILALLSNLILIPIKCKLGDREFDFRRYSEIMQYFPDVEGELLLSGFDVCYTVSLENVAFGLLRMENGYIVVGPVPALDMVGVNSIEALRYDGIPTEKCGEFEAFMSGVAIYDLKRFITFLQYISKYHLQHSVAETKFVDYPPPCAEGEKKVIAKTPLISFDIFSAHTSEFGASVSIAIEMGQVEELEHALSVMGPLFKTSFANFTSSTDMHDRFVMALARACDSAVKGGMSLSDLDAMQYHYLELLSKISSYRDIVRLMKSMLIDFATRVHRLHSLQSGDPLVRQICRLAENHLHDKMTPTLIAVELGKDTAYICNRFKKATGKTITEYIQETKIREAQYVLTTTDKPITEVAMQFGFSTANYFCTVFRKLTGCAPSEFRDKKRI